MSSVATLHLLRTPDLPTVVAAGPSGLLAILRDIGAEADDEYFWPGEHLLFVIQQLWHRDQVSFFSSLYPHEERALNDDARVTFLIGEEHRELLPRLQPSLQDSSELAKGLVARGVRSAEARLAARDAVTLLCEQIAALPPGCLLVLHVAPTDML